MNRRGEEERRGVKWVEGKGRDGRERERRGRVEGKGDNDNDFIGYCSPDAK